MIRNLTKLDRCYEGRPLYRLDGGFSYTIDFNGHSWKVTIPAGEVTDFASIPKLFHRLLNPSDPRWDEAAVVHD